MLSLEVFNRSDILTPLTALGVPFEIDDHKGPLIESPIHSIEQAGCNTLFAYMHGWFSPRTVLAHYGS